MSYIVERKDEMTVGELIEELKKVPADYGVGCNTQDGAIYSLTGFVAYDETKSVILGD